MNKRSIGIAAAVIAIAAAAVSLYFTSGGRSERIDLDPYNALGTVMGEETAKLIGNKGQVLVMIRGMGAGQNPALDAELSALQKTLKRQKGVSVLVEKVKLTPVQMMATGGAVPADQFLSALETHPGLAALVLFMGFPQLNEAQADVLKKSGAKTLVARSLRPSDQQLLEREIIHVAIVPRPDAPPPGGPAPRTLRERFDQDYLILAAPPAGR
jgi:hypothetical protein